MKTNKLMSVSFSKGTLHIEHKTAMGELSDIFTIGNNHRTENGRTPANITHFVNSKSTQEFIAATAKHLNIPKEEVVFTKGRGKNARVMANMFLLIYAAEYLSPEFHVAVIDVFLTNKLLTWRDDSGDLFKELNKEISDSAENLLGKPAHSGHFITLAKIVNSRVLGDGLWDEADAKQLKERTRIETALITSLKMGFIKDWEHLKQVAAEI